MLKSPPRAYLPVHHSERNGDPAARNDPVRECAHLAALAARPAAAFRVLPRHFLVAREHARSADCDAFSAPRCGSGAAAAAAAADDDGGDRLSRSWRQLELKGQSKRLSHSLFQSNVAVRVAREDVASAQHDRV